MNMWKTLNKGIMKAFGMNIETDTATLNDESFLEWVGIKRDSESKKPTSDVTYFTCLKMMSETVAKMPWKLYQKTNKGISEPIDNDIARLMKQRPNPFMTQEDKVTTQTATLKGSFYERACDGNFETQVDESNLLTEHTDAAAAIKNWFGKVQEPTEAA